MSTRQREAAANGASTATDIDAVIVGAGFAGLYMLHRLRGLGLSARVLEAADGVGGTWYWNRYPGVNTKSESLTICCCRRAASGAPSADITLARGRARR